MAVSSRVGLRNIEIEGVSPLEGDIFCRKFGLTSLLHEMAWVDWAILRIIVTEYIVWVKLEEKIIWPFDVAKIYVILDMTIKNLNSIFALFGI